MQDNQDKDTSKDEVGTEYKIILKKILFGAWISVCCECVCVIRYKSMRLADPSSRGVLLPVVRHCSVVKNLKNGAAVARIGLLWQRRRECVRACVCIH